MKTLLSLLLFLLPLCAKAGGSVEFDYHAKPLLQKDPSLYKFVIENLDFSKVGDGARLGKDAGPDQGKRVPPFTFEAKPKSHLGAFIFILIIDQNEDGLPVVTIKPISPPHPSAKIQAEQGAAANP